MTMALRMAAQSAIINFGMGPRGADPTQTHAGVVLKLISLRLLVVKHAFEQRPLVWIFVMESWGRTFCRMMQPRGGLPVMIWPAINLLQLTPHLRLFLLPMLTLQP